MEINKFSSLVSFRHITKICDMNIESSYIQHYKSSEIYVRANSFTTLPFRMRNKILIEKNISKEENILDIVHTFS